MPLTRRQFLAASSAVALSAGVSVGQTSPEKLGIVLYSYSIRVRQERGFNDPCSFLEFCRQRGAGGVQLPLGIRPVEYTTKLRDMAEKQRLFVEGSVTPPRDPQDVAHFEAEVRTARAAGALVVRTVMLGGRRYETFKTAADYRAFTDRARRSLELAEPIVARHKLKLAVENHKDYRTEELAELMRRRGSEWLGVCVDTGNNLALLEDPYHTVQTLAPWAFCCHLKDMAVADSPEGFLLAEVPLGEGFLDPRRLVAVLRKARPGIRFSLEMITRDPLSIPCLGDNYWATFADVPGRDLARTLALVRRHVPRQPLLRVSSLSMAEQLAVEDRNVRRSLEFAQRNLGL